MTSLLTTLWLLLVCQLLLSGAQGLGDEKIAPKVAALPDGYVPHEDIGVAYKVYDTANVSWTRASELCNLEGAKLAVIDTTKKLDYARVQPLAGDHLRHVGIHRVGDDWVSVSNETISTSIPWAAGEPGDRENGFVCVMVGWKKLLFDGLINGRCDAFLGEYICELPIPKPA